MLRHLLVGLAIVQLISCDFILPTYRPPPQSKTPKIYRVRREATQDEPQWIYQGDDIERAPSSGDHPFLPQYIDDVKLDSNTRYVRSVDSPSAKRGGGSGTRSSGSRGTGATHPGYNRRNTRNSDKEETQWNFQEADIDGRFPTSDYHPLIPQYIDNLKHDPDTRHARSVDSPSARRGGGSRSGTNTGSRDTGPTHPGYNRRNTRSADRGEPLWIYRESDVPKAPSTFDHPFLPNYIDDIKLDQNQRYTRSIEPLKPLKVIKPFGPRPRPLSPFIPDWPRPLTIYAGSSRVVRDIHIAGVTDRKPSHRNVIIPNWNPNARIKPWQTIGVRHI